MNVNEKINVNKFYVPKAITVAQSQIIKLHNDYKVAQKSKPLPIDQKIVSVRLYLFVKLKYESSTIILFVVISYSMREWVSEWVVRDLLSDLNNYDWPAN